MSREMPYFSWEAEIRCQSAEDLVHWVVEHGHGIDSLEGNRVDGYSIDLGYGDRVPWDPATDLAQALFLFFTVLPKIGWHAELYQRPTPHAFVNTGQCEVSKFLRGTLTVSWGEHKYCHGVTTPQHAILITLCLAIMADRKHHEGFMG